MKLWALSDLHVGYRANRELLAHVSPRPGDWLILAGDVGETLDHLRWTLDHFQPRFARLLWVPGNHELWTSDEQGARLGGASKYAALEATFAEACAKDTATAIASLLASTAFGVQ